MEVVQGRPPDCRLQTPVADLTFYWRQLQSFISGSAQSVVLQCSISECKSEAIRMVKISFKENRNLCKKHYILFRDKDVKHASNFIRASKSIDKDTIEKFNN